MQEYHINIQRCFIAGCLQT